MAGISKWLLGFLLFAMAFRANCQSYDSITKNEKEIQYFESLTLRLYYEAKWDSLLNMGQLAISKGYNYYYMLLRVGAASYYTNKYSLAARYLENARKLYGADDFTNELLFYAYIYTGRNQQASLLKKDLSLELKLKLRKTIGSIFYFEGGPIMTDGDLHAEKLMKNNSIITFSDKYFEKNAVYFVTGWRQPVKNRFWLTASVSYLDFNKHRDVQIKYWDSLGGDYKVRQTEYYFSAGYTVNNRIFISPCLRLTDTKVSEPITSADTITKLYLGLPVSKSFNDHVWGGEFLYAANYWKASAGAWSLRIGDTKSWQLSTSLVLLPMGNLNLYAVTSFTWKSSEINSPYVISQSCGVKLVNRTWLEVTGTYGNVAGTSEYNGQLLNNQINKSKYRLSSIVLIDLSSKMRFSLRYQYMKNESQAWFLNEEYKLIEKSYNYNRHIITGGLTWDVL
ncbi:MAG: hypothetical protein ACM3ME_10495 [Chloroflexota bacterium]